MVLYDPHRKWAPRAICREEDEKLFFSPGGQPNRKPSAKTQVRWDQAKEICKMCPVLAECARDTLGEEYGVYGGLDQYERFKIRMALRKAVRNWPEERRRAWGKDLYELRQTGMHWGTIYTRTGLPQSAAEWLVNGWTEHLKSLPGTTAEVVDLPLPEPEDEDQSHPPFPDRAGRRDAWVRHRGVVSDAWYRGETPDGAWINCTTQAGRGQVHKWFPAKDVHLYRPSAVVILNYKARPDEQQHDLTA
jgi:WhiB family redox-sensing transcriptional regulator